MDFKTFLALQLERIRGKPQPNAPGPKRPTLEQIDRDKLK